ncbi:ArnT family glycosyltransferase [Reichenbachiella sp.]|uniref:ArnT family glycosyltransferase n=1 Tax=Reichenbachiella sp. TaxID=2184521 RepID=UPI003BAF2612
MKKPVDEQVIQIDTRYAVILFYASVFMVFLIAIFRDFDRDELEAVHSAWKLLQGESIYKDFFQHHHAFLYHLISPVIDLFGEDVIVLYVLRLINFSCFLGMLWCTFQIMEVVFQNKQTSWLSVFLLASTVIFVEKAIEIRPDVPQILFGLFAILFLFRHVYGREQWTHLLSAFCLGVSFLFLQKAIFIVAGLGALQLIWHFESRFSLKKLITYWLIFGITISPYFILLISEQEFENYVFWNWIINMHFDDAFSPFKVILNSFYYNHILWVFFLLGIINCFKNTGRDLSILSLLLLGSVFLVQAPYRQYFMSALPLMCGVAAYGMLNVLSLKRLKLVVILAFIVPAVFLVRTLIVYPNAPQVAKINWVLNHTEPTDFVYDGNIDFNIFRKDLDFFWYSVAPGKGGLATYQKLKPYTYDIYVLIEECSPRLISNKFIEDINHPIIKEQYKKSSEYDDLYIRKSTLLLD